MSDLSNTAAGLVFLTLRRNRLLKESASSLPPEFASFRVLPSLASALEFGGASAAQILPLLLQLGKSVA